MKYLIAIVLVLLVGNVSAAREERGIRVGGAGAEEVRIYKESHALVIGVSDYRKDWPDLPGVKQDVQAVRTALEDHGFKVVSVADPTRRQLEDQFNGFISAHGQDPDNRLLFYFAGHGHTLKLAYGGEMGYIVPADAPSPERDKPGFLATAMDMQMIEVYARRVQAKHAFFLFDSCFSGSIFSLSRAIPENISYKTTLPVRQFVTSGSADEQVPDQSVFRQQFIAALDGEGDLNDDGYVTGAELGEFLQNKVVNYSRGSQHPQYGKIRDPNLDKGDFVFPLPRATSTRQPAVGTAQSPAGAGDPEKEMWDLVKNSEVGSDLEAFLATYPQGRFAGAAKLKAQQLQRKQPAAPASAIAPSVPPTKGGLATKAPAPLPLAERYPHVATANTSAYLGSNRWDWTVMVDADAQTLAQISCVEYTLHGLYIDHKNVVWSIYGYIIS